MQTVGDLHIESVARERVMCNPDDNIMSGVLIKKIDDQARIIIEQQEMIRKLAETDEVA